MPGLASSRWAARSSRHHPGQTSSSLNGSAVAGGHPGNELRSPAEELTRYTKIVRRLKWKLPYLAAGYRQATASSIVENGFGAHPAAGSEARAEAELMFKLDFFEYYMLLERALVHLLGVFGIAISRGGFTNGYPQREVNKDPPAAATTAGANGFTNGYGNLHVDRASSLPPPLRPSLSAPGTSNPRTHSDAASSSQQQASTMPPTFTHRYHANVLDALDNPSNPLYDVLGPGTAAGADVRRQLARAKDLRNRWKNADESNDGTSVVMTLAALESYDLERILATIFAGFDAAFTVAERFVVEQRESEMSAVPMAIGEENGSAGGPPVDWDMGTEEEEWEFMVEAMDWEAV